ncbi:MAG TPA: N-acetylmuramoyl-L-alanine amidase [Candidatus Hydrogenedentes bacterium]|nr:N-acetylmuramoyl-L-alanine amidase [Candidatus Hydrogenedentota bacterium]HQM48558.1 N-acetylmuramoyl-L-alanine amidase [Candidatus Hydrogenedentota bacterium]
MKRTAIPVLLAVVLGCQTTPPEPGVTPAPVPITETAPPFRLEDVPPPDMSALAGRRICIDPGHGGHWPGAVAPSNKLRESDVNLEVALALRELLRGAGAEVVLTRESDAALDPSRLSRDLAARAELANGRNAEAFISVHHNAHIVEGSDKNDLEVYYKLGDAGPSLDLAQCMMREMALRVRQDPDPKRLLPGNYKVLRDARVPAVLMETSYMTNARNASFMGTRYGVEKEAAGLASGLAAYFAMEPPSVVSHNLVEYAGGRTQAFVFTLGGGLPLDRDTFELRVDGRLMEGMTVENGATITWFLGQILPNGPREVSFFARNMKGASLSYEAMAIVDRPPAFLTVHQYPEQPVRASGIECMFEVYVTDRFGLPAADGTPVTVNGNLLRAATSAGTARCYFLEDALPAQLEIRAGDIVERIAPRFGGETYRTVRLHTAGSSEPIAGVTAFHEGSILGTSNSEGWLPIPADTRLLSLRKSGYDDIEVKLNGGHAVVGLIPSAGGMLHGKTVVLDAANGGGNAGATGPTGMRASDVSFDVVRRVANRLRELGARVVMTREDDNDPPPLERIRQSDAAGASIHVVVAFGADTAAAKVVDKSGHLTGANVRFAAHYPGSANGERLAQTVSKALGDLPVTTSVTYVLQQTACPAVWVQPQSIEDARTEYTVMQPDTRRALAEALAGAIKAYFTSAPVEE